MNAGAAFDRLTPALRHHIVHALGFSGLRPVQALTTDAILDGDNCVVLAPTAGGKTEAAFFPLLSAMDTQQWGAPSVLYLSPIKALLNNQQARLDRLAALLSRRVFKWHGDVTPSEKRAFLKDPTDILMTTPESLEVMLISEKVPSRLLFKNLRAVVIDEVHAFAGDDRGAHLVALLERLQRHCGVDVQRIGLSATVGNPDDILTWLQGTSARPKRLVDPPKPPPSAQVRLDHVGNLHNAARVVLQLQPRGKTLVFVDSRRRVEQMAEALQGQIGAASSTTTAPLRVFPMHASLSTDERHQAELAFAEGSDCIIVATSTMELGIDVGDLDSVFQIDAPPSVASFLQRMGRTGRRQGTTSNCTFLCTEDFELMLCAAFLRLWRAGWVEPVNPDSASHHVLAQQLLALTLQEHGVAAADWWAWLSGAACFSTVTEEERASLLERMIEQDIVVLVDGRILLGAQGEKLYGRKNFAALYAVFDAPRSLTIMWGPDEIGSMDALFVQGLDSGACFVLGGRSWKLVDVDWKRSRCDVIPAPQGAHVSWQGGSRIVRRRHAEAIREVLLDDVRDPEWTTRAFEAMKAIRSEHSFVHDEERPVHRQKGSPVWFTFLGTRANNLLSRVLREKLAAEVTAEVTADHLCIRFRGEAAKSDVAVRDAIREVMAPGAVTADDAIAHVSELVRRPLSKFQPCLPPELEARFLARRLLELPFGSEPSRG